MNQRIRVLIFASALMIVPAVVHADESDAAKQEAKKLYTDAAQDMAQNAFGRACPKLEAALKILPGHIRTAMSLAECFDKWGRPASALEVFEATRPLAVSKGDSQKVAEIDSRMADVNTRVSRIQLIVPDDIIRLPGLAILRSGVPVVAANWGKPMPVNPGTYEIEISALDKPSWKTSVDVKPGQRIDVPLTPTWSSAGRPVPDDTAPVVKPEMIKPKVADVSPQQTETPPMQPSSGRRIAGFVGIGIGVVGLGIGAGMGGAAISKNNASNDGPCDAETDKCNQVGYDLRIAAQNLGNASTGLLIAGGLLLATGVTLVVLAPTHTKRKEDGTHATVWIGPGRVGLRGQW
jgi:hypothetical protein